MPVFLMGRFALGMDTVNDITKTNILGGIYYRFNSNVQTMILLKLLMPLVMAVVLCIICILKLKHSFNSL